MQAFTILSINVSELKGMRKAPVSEARLVENFGIAGDAHGGDWHRQVSMLASEDVEEMLNRGVEINYGDFAENITTSNICLAELPIGSRLFLGEAVVEVTQIGKECHSPCAIFNQLGFCVMPRKGIFAKVIKGGVISRESRCFFSEDGT